MTAQDHLSSPNHHVCTWWIAYTFDNPVRKLFHNPQKIFDAYIKKGMTVMDAILMSEGLTDIAKANDTKVYRKSKSRSGKTIEKISVHLDKVIFEGDLSKNILLKPGDIIHVPRSFF